MALDLTLLEVNSCLEYLLGENNPRSNDALFIIVYKYAKLFIKYNQMLNVNQNRKLIAYSAFIYLIYTYCQRPSLWRNI